MSFTIVYNADSLPIDLSREHQRLGANVKIVGSSRQTVLTWSDPSLPLDARDRLQNFDLDGRFFIIGRVRLDAREILLEKLPGVDLESDGLLCLHAYALWGEQCLEHLQGDFCFAIWDEPQQKLFCARDHLGIRSLFYSKTGSRWLVGDDLEIIAAQGGTDLDLDVQWISDFLSTGFPLDFDRTVYKHIKRLPPAHTMSISSIENKVISYWSLDIQDVVYFSDRRQYLTQFREIVSRAIADRLPEGQVGIALSGGLDSPTLAALASNVVCSPSRVVAETRYFASLMPDDEKHFSSLVANRLGIDLAQHAIDDAVYDAVWSLREIQTPEPSLSIINALAIRRIETEMSRRATVWFYGEGPDNALRFEWMAYLLWLRNKREWFRLATTVWHYFKGKKPREWWLTFRGWLPSRRFGEQNEPSDTLSWLNPAMADDADLVRRRESSFQVGGNRHPWHPEAVASFKHAIWQDMLGSFDSSTSGTPIGWRHPYLDIRVVTFLLSVPPIPWARRKFLIREAMKDFLPHEILTRPKTPLNEDPVAIMLDKSSYPNLPFGETTLRFVNPDKLALTPESPSDKQSMLRVHILNHWLLSHGYR